MGEYLLGIDIGTSACKIAVFAKDGTVKATGTGDYQVYYPHPGWAEQNPEEWWEAVCDAIPRVLIKGNISPEEIKGIGIDGQSWSAIAVDKDGNVLTNTPIWMDTRATDICEEFNEKIGKDKIFELCGNSLQPSYTTAKIIWYQRNLPEVYAKTYKILQSNSYIAYKLTGVMTQDLSQGYGLHCFDMRTGTWNKEMCQEFGFSSELLPEIHACHEVIGEVNEKAAKESGLAEGTPVVAGGLDAACGTLGAGVIHSGETQEQGGQAGGMSICTDQYRADERLILGFHVVPDCWLLQGGTTGGGGVMRWLEREFGAYEREEGKRQGKSSLDLFNEEAAAVAPGSDGVIWLTESTKGMNSLEEWESYIEEYTEKLEEQARKAEQEREGVLISTLHGVKGLEYEQVYILNVNEGSMPYRKAVLEPAIEEERRLFYVGMTRARKQLALCYVRQQYEKKREPSRFLKEAGV